MRPIDLQCHVQHDFDDDEEGMRLGIKKALTLEGYQVTCVATTGREARRICDRERFNCAFIDLRLPDIPGDRSPPRAPQNPELPWS